MMRCNLRGELHCSHMLRIAFYAVYVRPAMRCYTLLQLLCTLAQNEAKRVL
jgi:hypothetical protein